MKIRIKGKKAPKFQMAGQFNSLTPPNPFISTIADTEELYEQPTVPSISIPQFSSAGVPGMNEAPQEFFNQKPFETPSWEDQLRASGIGPQEDPQTIDYRNNPAFAKQYDESLYNYHSQQPRNRESRKYLNWYNQKYDVKPNKKNELIKLGNALNTALNVATPIVGMIDQRNQNRAIQQAYRTDQMYAGPVNPTANRGDYELNTGMVDPYNTGAKSKGQFANQYWPMAQDGMYLAPLSLSDSPVFRNVYENTMNPLGAPVESNFGNATFGSDLPVNSLIEPSDNTVEKTKTNKSFRDIIAYKESRNNYKAQSKKSSAAGKYQFMWSLHKNDIEQITGIKTKEEFLNNPKAQESYFDYWDANVLTPNAKRIKEELGIDEPLDAIKARIHFAGPKGAYRYYKSGIETTDAYGTKVSSYGQDFMKPNDEPVKTKSGVNIDDLNPTLKIFTQNISSMFPGLVISSGNDSKHMKGSKHYKNKAIDIGANSSNADDYQALKQYIAKNPSLKRQYGIEDIIDEGDHLHIELMEDGGQLKETNMKIRIINTPVETMAYGGQTNYGLDLGRRQVTDDMNESIYENVGNTLGPSSIDEATIEAEKGETILTDVDGDGMREHMNIGGKRHSEGGTPLKANPGDFIFSDTKRMKIKDQQLLNMFGKGNKKGGYTPAEIAKQYNLNKYKAILQDPNSDELSRRTAERMMMNYEKKLGQLALVQESKKGFPQGIPQIAESALPQAGYGGHLYKANTGVEFDYNMFDGIDPWLKSRTVAGRTSPTGLETVNRGTVEEDASEWESIIPGYKMMPNDKAQAAKYDWLLKNNPAEIERMWREYGLTTKGKGIQSILGLTEKDKDGRYSGKFPQDFKFTPEILAQLKDAYVDNIYGARDLYPRRAMATIDNPRTNRSFSMPGIPVRPRIPVAPPGTDGGTNNTDGGGKSIIPGTYNETGSRRPYGWTQQDRNNLALALMNRASIRKYPALVEDAAVDMPDFRNMDWRGRAAELQGMYNNQFNTLATYGPSSSLGANASFLAGQQAEQLIGKAIDPIEQQNVQIYNQVANQRSGIMNQALQQKSQNKFLRSKYNADLNQQYDNSIRDANKALTMATNQGITNASGLYNTNITESPYYYYDPRFQTMRFDSNAARAAFEAARNSSPNTGDAADEYMRMREKFAGLSPEEMKIAMDYITSGRRTGQSTATTYPYNPTRNRYTVQQPLGAIASGTGFGY